MENPVQPRVIQFMPCESATFDETTNAWVLYQPLYDVELPEGATFPFCLDQIAIYVQLADVVGTLSFRIEFRSHETNRVVSLSQLWSIQNTSVNRSVAYDTVIVLQKIPLIEPGWYEFSLVAGRNQMIASASLIVHNFGEAR